MNYIPLNVFVTLENEVYKCVGIVGEVIGSCGMCDFDNYGKSCMDAICNAEGRDDCTEVIFILYDNISEDTQID